MSFMNIPLLKRVKAAILKHPDQFEMAWWFDDVLHLGGLQEPVPAGGCGTAACIGGWVCHLSSRHQQIKTTSRQYRHSSSSVYARARSLLAINDDQAERLFGDSNWPEPYRTRYDNSKTALTRAKVAARRIDHFVKTKGKE